MIQNAIEEGSRSKLAPIGANKEVAVVEVEGEREVVDQRSRSRRRLPINSWVSESQILISTIGRRSPPRLLFKKLNAEEREGEVKRGKGKKRELKDER